MDKLRQSTPLPIQQTVHGYSDGHRLLASSMHLPKDAERILLLLSDLSGSTGGEQFDPYLTGYPVASAGYYALARTWPAPEMPRPGCVWTHTLLIPDELLGEMTHPEFLLPLFRRPSGSEYSGYQEGIPVPDGFRETDTHSGNAKAIEQSLAEGLLLALYGSNDPRTVLTVPRYSVADSPLLSIWRLQWQSLRYRFTFCGGSRGQRNLDGDPFILQAALEKDLRRLDRGPTPPRVVPWLTGNAQAAEEWIREAAESCINPTSDELQTFVERIGKKLPGETLLFRPVVKTYIILRDSAGTNAVASLIEFAAEEYPEPGKGSEYKLAVLGAGNRTGLSELSVIRGLAFTKQHHAFDAKELDLRARSAGLWKKPEEAWDLLKSLLATDCSPLAEEIIHGIVAGLPVSYLSQVLEASSDIIAGIIGRNQQLAISPTLWASKPEHQSRAAAALLKCREAVASSADEIIRLALNVAADPASPTLIEVFGPSSVRTVLDWVDADEGRTGCLRPGWRAALANQEAQVVEWLSSRPSVKTEIVAFALSLIDADTLSVNPSGMAAFAKHIPMETVASQSLVTALAGRLLRVSLASELPVAIDLAVACLDPVYHAAAESRMPDDLWQELTPWLPEGYWWTWDRCHRLRAGIAEKFRSEQWPAARLSDITRDDVIFREIVAELKERRSGRRVLADAVPTVDSESRRELLVTD